MTMASRLVLASGCVLLLAGCDALEPYGRSGTWRPTGVGQANLAVMVVNPQDLVHGHGGTGADGASAAAAVDRLRHDKVKSLSDAGGSSNASPSAGLSSN
jgi:hypothetical protein